MKTGDGDEREGYAQVYSVTLVERSASWLAQREREASGIVTLQMTEGSARQLKIVWAEVQTGWQTESKCLAVRSGWSGGGFRYQAAFLFLV